MIGESACPAETYRSWSGMDRRADASHLYTSREPAPTLRGRASHRFAASCRLPTDNSVLIPSPHDAIEILFSRSDGRRKFLPHASCGA